ncbi:MAG: hypothetical protein PHQ04_11505 [Opitutaceae bacterium]|nr:hypothetical protein [Opitutaceae bacterium]
MTEHPPEKTPDSKADFDRLMRARLAAQLGLSNLDEVDQALNRSDPAKSPVAHPRSEQAGRDHEERTRAIKQRLAVQLGGDVVERMQEFSHDDAESEFKRRQNEREQMMAEAAQAARVDREKELQEAAERESRAESAAKWSWVMLGTFGLAIVALIVFAPLLFVELPDAALLKEQSAQLAQQVLPLYNSASTPLSVASTREILLSHRGAWQATYEVEIALQLRQNLLAGATSNGAQPYLLLQQSLEEARFSVTKHRLYAEVSELRLPAELPMLLEVVHRAGEKLTIRLPLQAVRGVFGWHFLPVDLTQRRPSRQLGGAPLSFYESTPHLIFGRGGGDSTRIRELMREARAYVTTVNKELAQRGLSLRRASNNGS